MRRERTRAGGRPGEVGGDLVIAAPMRLEARALRRGVRAGRVVRTGMGPKRSRRAAAELAEDPAASLAVAGLCGALDSELAPGDVVVASSLALDGEAPGRALESAPALVGLFAEQGVRAYAAPLVSTGGAVHGAERDRLARSGARGVDMESAWLAEAARGRPFAVARVVLDGPGFELYRPARVASLVLALRRLRQVAEVLELWGTGIPVHCPTPIESRLPRPWLGAHPREA